jgi:uncharacterized protein YjeT (DUF2065 family)
MIDDVLLGLGLVAVVEGLILALSPQRLEQALEMARALGPDRLRVFGLIAVASGIGLIWVARG